MAREFVLNVNGASRTLQADADTPLIDVLTNDDFTATGSPAGSLELSRRGLLRGGGALIIGFPLAGPALAQSAEAARGATAGPPDPNAIDTWIAIHADNTASIYTGKCELGQGNTTGLIQIAAEQLDLDLRQITAERIDTNMTPDQGPTSASTSIYRGGPQLRAAAAEARQELLARAAVVLGVQVGSLQVDAGVVTIAGETNGRRVTYGALVGDKPFNLKFTGTAPQKPSGSFRIVATSPPRVDMPAKARGTYTHMHHLRAPGMLHGRIVLPRGQRSFGAGARPAEVDEASIRHIPGARLVRKGDFIGVVAEREWDAVKAARDLKVTWKNGPALPRAEMLHELIRKEPTKDTHVAKVGDPQAAFARAVHVRSATYHGPYQSHAPFAPNCALADVRAEGAVVQCSSQDIYSTRKQIADVLGMAPAKVRVQYYEGSGTFGRSCYEEVAQGAALLSQIVGKPVRVQFMRWDELGWDNYGPPHLADVRIGADANGKIVAYEYDGWQHGWTVTSTIQDSALLTPGKERPGGSKGNNLDPININPIVTGSMYAIPDRRVTSHMFPMDGYLRGAALRSPLDLSFCFASEQTVDELAAALEMDPLEFRRRNIGANRWRDVLEAAAKGAGWTPRPGKRQASATGDVVSGRGIAMGTHQVSYGAAVAEVEVNRRTGVITVKRLCGALDCGLAVNPGLVENQIIGQMVQATSRVLKEEVTFDQTGVTSLDWNSYPVLRFSEYPEIVPVVVQRRDEPSTGAGEECMGAAAAAIANAVFDATGVRLRQYPMTPERVLKALAANRI